ncbi:ZIP family metal transporter [Peribacillus simplex]|uniref:ZIP family metal transporter n=1 Tax=Peribacillus simplex TaxID=1478 RepID=UPI003CF036E6
MTVQVVIYTLLSICANLMGGLVLLIRKDWSNKSLKSFLALCTGFLFSLTIFDLIPETIEMGGTSSTLYIFAGFLLLFLIQTFYKSISCTQHKKHQNHITTVSSSMAGILIHSFFDGLLIVSTFLFNQYIGIAVLLGIMLHKFFDGFILSTITYTYYRNSKKLFIPISLLILSTLLGIGVPFALSESSLFTGKSILVSFLSITAGIFLYISTVDLITLSNLKNDRIAGFFFLFGISVFILLHSFSHY